MTSMFDLAPSQIPYTDFNRLNFGCYSNEEIDRLSVIEVTQTKTFDAAGFPVRNGLYDPHFGPSDQFAFCETCSLKSSWCPGHYGHIKLNMPVFNPMLFPITYEIMKGACVHCHRFFGSCENGKKDKKVDSSTVASVPRVFENLVDLDGKEN